MTSTKPVATDTPQRAYRAPCPGCGAPVEFRSAQSTHAVCGYCQSTVVRDGDTLSRIGKMAEVFNDFSPLQLLALGVFQKRPFTLVGRLQYQYDKGTWTEWHALFDDGSTAFLSEARGSIDNVNSANDPRFARLMGDVLTDLLTDRYPQDNDVCRIPGC